MNMKKAKEAVGGDKRESEAMVSTKDYKMRLMGERKFSYKPFCRKNKRTLHILTYLTKEKSKLVIACKCFSSIKKFNHWMVK